MKNTFGNNITFTVFGESHGPSIGVVIDGLAPGMDVDTAYIDKLLSLRRPSGNISTARQEADVYTIESGVFEGKTTGTPICIRIPNGDTRSKDYAATRWLARPSHADYTANCKYHGFEDYRGGGHFSGRITAAVVAAGAIVLPALNQKGIYIGTHIKKCAGIVDRDFSEDIKHEIEGLYDKSFATLDDVAGENMMDAIAKAKSQGNSVGGVLETVIIGMDAGVGEPMFDTMEGMLAHALYAIPGIKGVEFGAGFSIADMTGKEANDLFFSENGTVKARTNNAGGINGGITNGMPIIFRCAVRPTPTLGIEQNTIDMETKTDAVLLSKGRHDPCIVHRARIVVDCITALTVADMLCTRYGTDWLAKRPLKQNIVLTGMPGSGKSTIGKLLATELGMTFIDTDEEIVKRKQQSIPEIFAAVGEQGFRNIESEVICDLANMQNAVIATGGGAILNQANVEVLRKNGKIYFIDRELDDIVATSDRPLSSNRADLEKRYQERYHLYCSRCDKQIKIGNDPYFNMRKIVEDFYDENTCD